MIMYQRSSPEQSTFSKVDGSSRKWLEASKWLSASSALNHCTILQSPKATSATCTIDSYASYPVTQEVEPVGANACQCKLTSRVRAAMPLPTRCSSPEHRWSTFAAIGVLPKRTAILCARNIRYHCCIYRPISMACTYATAVGLVHSCANTSCAHDGLSSFMPRSNSRLDESREDFRKQ